MTQERKIDIDVLLRDTFLTVVELRQGTSARHGQELYRHCLQQGGRGTRASDSGRIQPAGHRTYHLRSVRAAGRNRSQPGRDG